MDVAEAVSVAWMGLYAFVSLFFAWLFHLRNEEPELLFFSAFAGGLSLHVTSTLKPLATQGYPALHVRTIAAAVATCGFVLLFNALSSHCKVLTRVTASWAAGLIVLVALDLMLRPSATNVGAVASGGVAVAPFLCLFSMGKFAKTARRSEIARPLLASSFVALAAGCHDLLVRFEVLATPLLVPHATLLFTVVSSYALLRRFVFTSDELMRRNEQLAHASRERIAAQQRLSRTERMASIGELSAVVAHQVRNPLAIIKNAQSALRRPRLNRESRDTLVAILDEETQRLDTLVNELLTFAQPAQVKGKPFELRVLIDRAVDVVRQAGGGTLHFDLHVDLSAVPSRLRGDVGLLHHVVVNLVDNAAQAMPGGGCLTIEASRVELHGEPAVALTFRDTGEGMAESTRAQASTPFFTTRPAGTGLGLAIVKRIVESHQGHLRIDSTEGAGTQVHLTLPEFHQWASREASAAVVPEVVR